MALVLSSWLPQAQKLAVGTKDVVQHDCGDGKKLVIQHKETGWTAWCYRCSDDGWHPKPKPSLAERIAALNKKREADDDVVRSIRPPMPAEFDPRVWPSEAKVWLYKAGLDNDWLRSIGFYWCSRLNRVVMPVLDDSEKLIFWQARGFDPELAKYLSPILGPNQHKPLYKAVPVRPVEGRRADVLCLTEDILSANKVAPVVTGWSLLGTALSDPTLRQIQDFGASRVWVWLDPDEAGVSGRRKIVPALRSLGIDAKAVRSDKDPKLIPLEEIRRKLI